MYNSTTKSDTVSIFTTACMEVGTIDLLTATCLMLYFRQVGLGLGVTSESLLATIS